MKPKLHAVPSFSVKADDQRSAGPAKDEDVGESPLTRLAATARDIYVRERTKFEQAIQHMQGTFPVPRDWDGRSARQVDDVEVQKAKRSVWEDLAEFAIRHRVDLHAYIAGIFSDLGIKEVPPSPKVLCGPSGQERWERIKKGCERGIELAANIETTTAIGRMRFYQRVMKYTAKQACRTVLTDDTLELSPLMRYCVAYSAYHDDIAEHFLPDAVMQFCRYEEFYLRHWRLLLPKGFKRLATDEYERLTGRSHG